MKEHRETMHLSLAAWNQLKLLLENPPSPTKAMKRAARDANKLFGPIKKVP